MRLSEKQQQEHRIKRIYDDALPPFDRLCKMGCLSPARQLELETLRQTTNPMSLRRAIQTLIDQLYALPVLKDGVVEDVRLSLFDPQAVPVSQ